MVRTDEDKKRLAERIRAARTYLEMSQTEFAQALGVSQSYLSNLEKGLSQPSVEVVRTLHKMTGWRYEWLIEGDGESDANDAPEEFQRRAIRSLVGIMDYKELNFIRRFIELYHNTHKGKQ
ncbi:MAG: helix-turn-helix transcriptional regulator [Acidaminococcaceae bacterium]|nr:helix-turn-helix transcriptional regulator [Acidaminococcaceae bacterium]